ncbi:hypothetical protein WMELPLUS_00460 [Wolbachia endosymbiont of Drosophila melanogaster]|nr:hypothetical protein WMELPLUS_00460 [Wolbachia endosymbiont of Drosophila melanogaster]CAI5616939.1 hypothetical protein WMELCS112_00441 [Wolbachia endosymbiont of Drosophila melanogaster]
MNAVLWSRVREIRKHGSFGETMVMRPNRWFQGHESLPDLLIIIFLIYLSLKGE